MKLILILSLLGSTAFAKNKKEWTPKYQSKKIKTLDKKILKNKSESKSLDVLSLNTPEDKLEALYKVTPKSKDHLRKLKKETMTLKQKSVPTLLKVMRTKDFPDENRWVATYMLGRIMGVKSAPLISKYASHPNWMLRLASLKVLLHLNQAQYKGIYAKLLEDQSLIVRHQALQNIKKMNIKDLAPYVWKMLYNKKNYVGLKGKRKRSHIIKDAIKTVGDLGFQKAKTPMLKMFQKTKYKDVFEELDYSLSKLSGTPSPKGAITLKKMYWNKKAAKETTI